MKTTRNLDTRPSIAELRRQTESAIPDGYKAYSFADCPGMERGTLKLPESNRVFIRPESLAALESGQITLRITSLKKPEKPPEGTLLIIGTIKGRINLILGGDNHTIVFGEDCRGGYGIRLWRQSYIRFGAKTTSGGIVIVGDRSSVVTGEDCMFSSNIDVQAADQHGIVDLVTGTLTNDRERHITLGNHVWVGRFATLLPDVEVGDGSIVGAGAVVTSKIPGFSVAVGTPARVVAEQRTWSRKASVLDGYSKAAVARHQAMGLDAEAAPESESIKPKSTTPRKKKKKPDQA